METPLQAVNRQIQQENDRYKRVVANLDQQKNQAKTQHEQTIRLLTNRKDQIKQYAKLENCFYTHCNSRRVTLEQMEETIRKAMEGLE